MAENETNQEGQTTAGGDPKKYRGPMGSDYPGYVALTPWIVRGSPDNCQYHLDDTRHDC